MSEGEDRLMERHVDQQLAAMPLQDLPPEASERIEAACLAELRRRHERAVHWRAAVTGALAATLASLLAGSILLWKIGRALAIYEVHFR